MTPDLPGEVMPARGWDEIALHLAVELDLGGSIRGTAVHRIAPLGAPDAWARFHAVGLAIDAVRIDGSPVTGWRIGEQTVDIPVPIGTGEREIAIDYHARPELGLHFRGAKGTDLTREVWSQGEDVDNRYWFPGWDYPNDRFVYTAEITAASDLVALSNGEITGTEALPDGRTRTSFALAGTIPNYLVAIAVGDYRVVTDRVGDVPIEYVVPSRLSEADARRTFDAVKGPLAWYGEMFGTPYPWSRNRQILVQRFAYVAMENPGVTLFDETMLRPDDTVRTHFHEAVIAHELAHHWFGDWLTCYGWRELWLNEGFAEYWDGRWLQHAHGPDAFAELVRSWRSDALHDRYPLAPRAHTEIDGREHGSVYDRGAMVLHMLHALLGDDVFTAGIRKYVADNAERHVETDDLRRALESVSGQHLGWFFDAWVHGGGAPTLTASHAWRDGELTVSVAQADGGVFTAPIAIELGGDVVTRHTVWVGPGVTRLVVPFAAPPKFVAVDPDCALLAAWTFTQTPAEWAAQLAGSPSACARWEAIEQLGKSETGDEGLAALTTVAGDEAAYVGVRAHAARAIGRHGAEAIDVLAELRPDELPWMRHAVAAALGEAGGTDELGPLLADPDEWVRASALTALERADAGEALVAARAAWKRPGSVQGWERSAAARILAEHGTTADLPGLIKRLSPSEGRATRRAAGNAAVALFHGLSEADQDKQRDALQAAIIPFLTDQDINARFEACGWIGTIGDSDGETALRLAAAATTVPELREAMRDAGSAIRSRVVPDEKPPDDPQRLAERLEALEARTERLEQWR